MSIAAEVRRASSGGDPSGDSLPEGWARAKLPEIATISMGQSPPGASYNESGEGLPFFQGKADFGDRHPRIRVWCTDPRRVAEPGDVLLSVRAPVGPTNVADRRCIIGRGLAAIRPISPIPAGFVLFYLRLVEPVLAEQGTGSTFTAVNRDHLESLEVGVPPLPEQHRILGKVEALLARVNATRERLARVTPILKRFRQSVLAAACSGRVTGNWREKNSAVASVVGEDGLPRLLDRTAHARYWPCRRALRQRLPNFRQSVGDRQCYLRLRDLSRRGSRLCMSCVQAS
jgi:type I restriction enzyme S subunit